MMEGATETSENLSTATVAEVSGQIAHEAQSQSACPYCGKLYKRVNTHISRSHPEIFRQKIVDRQCPRSATPSCPTDGIVSDIKTTQHALTSGLTRYKEQLNEWRQRLAENKEEIEHFKDVEGFIKFLAGAIDLLPGPTHPARKYYSLRKSGQAGDTQNKKKYSSNPERATKRARERRKARYRYELTQYLFYNQRRKAVRGVLNTEQKMCRVERAEVEQYYSQLYAPSTMRRAEYSSNITASERMVIDETYDTTITKEEIIEATKGIAVDTAPGPDGILVRAIKDAAASESIASIASRMLVTGAVPPCLNIARTVLLFKSGDEKDLKNWRPITICSVVRRVIERVLDKRFRAFVSFNEHQNGFTRSPGALINTSLLSSLLDDAKVRRGSATIVFLDIRKAFDSLSHEHLSKTIASSGAPTKLASLICALQTGNKTQIQLQTGKTKYISLNKGVMQGSPLSPALYNVCTDHILDELCEDQVAAAYGYELVKGLKPLTVLGFADDVAILAKDTESAISLAKMAIQRFHEIGLEINSTKSTAISIHKGLLKEETLSIAEDNIRSISQQEMIKYLGTDFNSSILFNKQKLLTNLKTKLDLLASSPLLLADQKLNVLSGFIAPSFIYSFQSGPIANVPVKVFEDADRMIRSALKEIVQLPNDTPDAMLYTDSKYKGLGLFKLSWEAYLQRMNGLRALARSRNKYVEAAINLEEELERVKKPLGLSPNVVEPSEINTRKIRQDLRNDMFERWCQLPHKGRGVVLYGQYPTGNRWTKHHSGLSCSEWRDALKMVCNVAPVRSVPGRSQDGNRCRHCSEIETLAHVLGSCPRGELLRNTRHHQVRASLAMALREIGYTVHEEVHGIGDNDSHRRIDMIAFKEGGSEGFIIDPTVRFESHLGQPEEVDEEKRQIYLPTIPYYLEKYKLSEIKVIGLMVGARGTATTVLVNFFRKFGLKNITLDSIIRSALLGSLRILRHHLTKTT